MGRECGEASGINKNHIRMVFFRFYSACVWDEVDAVGAVRAAVPANGQHTRSPW